MDRWLGQLGLEIDTGCIYISGATEFDDRPGPVHDTLTESVNLWLGACVARCSKPLSWGHLRADTDPKQMASELHGLALALHFEGRFLRDDQAMNRARRSVKNLFARHQSQPET